MNTSNFDKVINKIEKEFEFTDLILEINGKFIHENRVNFNLALNQLLQVLTESHEQKFESDWSIARRIVQLKQLSNKIENIRDKILKMGRHAYFERKIQIKIKPLIISEIEVLQKDFGSKNRLPFSIGPDRKYLHKEVKKSLQVQNVNKIQQVEIEYFHLLSDYMDQEKVKELSYYSNIGSFEIYSLETWKEILNVFIKEGDVSEEAIGRNLLNIIQKAIPLSLKTFYALTLSQIIDPLEFSDMTYLKDLVESFDPSIQKKSLDSAAFLKKHTLKKSCSIPKSVIINEMAWDIIEDIKWMKKEEIRIFLLGTRHHTIVIQIACINAASELEKGKYQYKIFNTGSGVEDYHMMDVKKEYAYPLTYNDIPLETFSYSFTTELLRFSLEKEEISKLYELHDQVLVEQGGGTKILYSKQEIAYPRQKYGTCSYAAMRAWIDSFLNEDQRKHLEIIKSRISTDKQEKVVNLLKNNIIGPNWQSTNQNGKRKMTSKPVNLTEKKLEESKLLLKLGQEHLLQVIKG